MSKKLLFLLILLFLNLQAGTAGITSLSHIFLMGKGIQDLDEDNLPDHVALQIFIPVAASAYELAAAADIAARANLESLVVDFSLVKKESEVKSLQDLENPIFIGTNLEVLEKLKKEGKVSLPALNKNQGLVTLFSSKKEQAIAVIAGSEEALLQTARSFFLRWPYLWDIWGKDEGATYFTVENEIALLLEEEGLSAQNVTIQTVLYEFFLSEPKKMPLKRLKFDSGEIKNLTVEVVFSDKKDMEKAFQSLESLCIQQRKGLRTDFLNYPGCAQLTFDLRHGNEHSSIILPRLGYPRRILTPSYKMPFRPKISGKNFDLLNLFSGEGFYSDSDKDNILDTLDTSLIIPHNSGPLGAALLASRLVLETAGASFPIFFLDNEIEDRKALITPILIGQENGLNEELIKNGKLKVPALEKGWGLATVVPQAFNKSNALAIIGADRVGVEKTLTYLSQKYPYFNEYKDGEPRITDLPSDLEKFFSGERGSAEAYLAQNLKKIADEVKDRDLDYLKAEIYLPEKNKKFEELTRNFLEAVISKDRLEIQSFLLREAKTIFEKEKDFPWEADEALARIEEEIKPWQGLKLPLKITLGLSESPKVRDKIKRQIETLLIQNKVDSFEVKVFSAYKQGFFWLTEEILPSLRDKTPSRLIIRVAEEKDDFSQPQRFYSEPYRWLQELYPADEILSREADIPLERIGFEMKKDKEPVYEVLAFDENNRLFLQKTFSPRRRKALFLEIFPEWGSVTLTTGWLKIEKGDEILLDIPLRCDLERFWDYYQQEILPAVYSHVMKKTGNEPTFDKQPYFKRIFFEMWFSEPDYRLELDEEIISSLEAIHDEIYFDTLDFLRGITDVRVEEEIEGDASRYSAPGNVLPLIHPSLEGGRGRVKVILEDWQAQSPQLELKWKEKGKDEFRKKLVFPTLKAKTLRLPSLVYNGEKDHIENLLFEAEMEKETEYLTLIDLVESYRELLAKGIIQPLRYPKLKTITLKIKFKELEKEEALPISFGDSEEKIAPRTPAQEEIAVPTDKIISPQMCLDIVRHLSRFKPFRAYSAGISFENRKIPVLEIFTPQKKYVSLPRLVTFKPTLYLSARQHANEVSSTNYALKFAELLGTEKKYQEYIKKTNFVIHPMENPDGAELAYELQKLTPFHSLHAGRYSSLGMDIGTQVNAPKPLLPEAKVRRFLDNRWVPDIYLNLHGYPSHEWVQQFSGYSPYLFRDYWIPRGWFAYYRSLSLPIYQRWKEAGEELRGFITKEMNKDIKIRTSNNRFYDRYNRWASRWQPHMNYLELYEGLNLYAKRRSSQENKLSPRSQNTFVEETPELMDETARGTWLEFLCDQGLRYLKAHADYLSEAEFEIARLEEEIRDRIHIQFIRSRPGKIKKTDER